MRKKISYLRHHWKLGVHLIFKTKRFGVNNKWWVPFDSLWGTGGPLEIILKTLLIVPLIKNYLALKKRMGYSVGFIPKKEYNLLFKKN